MTQRILDIISGKDTSLTASLTRGMMSILTPGYALANGVRQKLFDAGLKPSHALGRPTLSVGNLTTGGTGKTPMVAFLVQSLLAMGHRPTILLRGYKSTDTHGSDEAAVYVKQFGEQVPVIANPSRVEGAQQALKKFPQTTCFVLDDGFQHRQAKRDLDIVLIDATNPFGYGHLLPRGLMREPKSALKRADAIIVTRSDQVPPQAIVELDQTITRITGNAPIAHASHQWVSLLDTQDNEHSLELLNGKPCLAAIAIGNPDAFSNTLQSHATNINDIIIQPDHHAWTSEEITALVERAKADNAVLITTEKDYVKWPKLDANDPVYRVKLAMGFSDASEQNALAQMVQGILATDAHR